MGVFFERVGAQPQDLVSVEAVRPVLERSLERMPPADPATLSAETASLVDEVKATSGTAPPAAGTVQLQGQRLVVAAGIVALLVIAGIVTEANGWTDSSKAIWALATTAFGVIVGLLGGDAAK